MFSTINGVIVQFNCRSKGGEGVCKTSTSQLWLECCSSAGVGTSLKSGEVLVYWTRYRHSTCIRIHTQVDVLRTISRLAPVVFVSSDYMELKSMHYEASMYLSWITYREVHIKCPIIIIGIDVLLNIVNAVQPNSAWCCYSPAMWL